jgi:hypothetical protein
LKINIACIGLKKIGVQAGKDKGILGLFQGQGHQKLLYSIQLILELVVC